MLSCSCPHCGRAGINYRPQDVNKVFVCVRCGAKFLPSGAGSLTGNEATDERAVLPETSGRTATPPQEERR